jgi:hypothetical protein
MLVQIYPAWQRKHRVRVLVVVAVTSRLLDEAETVLSMRSAEKDAPLCDTNINNVLKHWPSFFFHRKYELQKTDFAHAVVWQGQGPPHVYYEIWLNIGCKMYFMNPHTSRLQPNKSIMIVVFPVITDVVFWSVPSEVMEQQVNRWWNSLNMSVNKRVNCHRKNNYRVLARCKSICMC